MNQKQNEIIPNSRQTDPPDHGVHAGSRDVRTTVEGSRSDTGNDLAELQVELKSRMLELEQIVNDRNSMASELEELRRQTECDKHLLWEIHSSKAWRIARFIHYLYGFATFKRETFDEFKSRLEDIAASCNSGGPSRPVAMMLFYITYGIANAARRLGIGSGMSGISDSEKKQKDYSSVYDSCYQDNETFLPPKTQDVQVVTFYLPQFHTFPENDEWWGKGFTEWVNTKKAQPRFPGHYQPRTPHRDIGYYDLSDVETMKRQAALAKAHGITAFCLYYYWFDGKKLMEKPLENLMAHPEVDFPFCLCWVNENWTRTWDGQENSVLIRQNYSEENDINFIKDLKRYIVDPRYLHCGGKPVILVYHVKNMPDPDKTFAMWRQWCRDNGVGEILIWSCRTFITSNKFRKSVEVDREVEFPPHLVTPLEALQPSRFKPYKNDGYYFNYQKIIHDLRKRRTFADISRSPFYRTAMLGWDNSCRRETGYSVWQYFSLESYYYWLQNIIRYTRRNFVEGERFIFINAWNEWGEGTYLEPDERYGYASINTTTRAIWNLPVFPEYEVLAPADVLMTQPGKVLIHFHIFYLDLLDEISYHLNQIPFTYDLEITTDSNEKSVSISDYLHDNPLPRCAYYHITVTRNIGRDVAPFFESCANKIDQYDFIGHFHSKKSPTVAWGREWRHYLLDQLLGSPRKISAIFRRFDRDRNLGLFFPSPFPAFYNSLNWESNRDRCVKLMKAMGFSLKLPECPRFPVGQMFWARTKAVSPIFRPGIVNAADFEEENNQLTDTFAHAIERIWKYVALGAGYSSLGGIVPPDPESAAGKEVGGNDTRVKRLAIFVHYSKILRISDADMYLLNDLKDSADIVFVSNSELLPDQVSMLAHFTKKIILRENKGFDFGAWRDALHEVDLSDYDELVLMNNSVYGPFRPFREIFSRMAGNDADFWGMTEFPETYNSRREEVKNLPNCIIPRHIQSYFIAFRKQVFTSDAFRDFWEKVHDVSTISDVVAQYEMHLTKHLENAGFKSDVYLRTASRLQESNSADPEFNAIYCRPRDFLILGFPFLKKNFFFYMEQKGINETVLLVSKLFPYPIRNIPTTFRTKKSILNENGLRAKKALSNEAPTQEPAIQKSPETIQMEKDDLRLSIRRRIFMKYVPDYAKLSGLEIGALCYPLLTKEDSDIKFYDICSKETLIERFGEFFPDKTFVDVDFVAGARSLPEVLGDNKFDYFIANHVVEHIPDFIGFFQDISERLNDGGIFFLAIPDCRFTFDHDRPETSAGHLIADHEDSGSVDAAEHCLDARIYHPEHMKINVYWSDIEKERYSFIHHHHVFNYKTFLDRIIKPLIRLRYFSFSVLNCHYEAGLDNEFIIVLEKCTDWDRIHVLGERIQVQPQEDMVGQKNDCSGKQMTGESEASKATDDKNKSESEQTAGDDIQPSDISQK